MDQITVDGLHENDFRRSIEDMLRFGDAETAAKRLRVLIEPYCGSGKVLPQRFLSIAPTDISLSGWGDLQASLSRYDRPEHGISALCMAIAEPETGQKPDETGLLTPYIETSYFSDEAFPFSEADRGDLLEGYSSYGCQWAGDSEGVDHVLSVEGVDDLYGALVRLESRLLDSDEPGEEDIRAGTLGSCYLGVLIHLAVRETIRRQGLPRPMAVMAGNNGIFPYFDAPVMSAEEYLAKGEIMPITVMAPPEPVDGSEAPPSQSSREDEEGYEQGSLLSIGIRRTAKKPVLVLDAADMAAGSLEQMANAQIMGLPMTMTSIEGQAAEPQDFDETDPQDWDSPVGFAEELPPVAFGAPAGLPPMPDADNIVQDMHEPDTANATYWQADLPEVSVPSAERNAPEFLDEPPLSEEAPSPILDLLDANQPRPRVPQGYNPGPLDPDDWHDQRAIYAADPQSSPWWQEVEAMKIARTKPEVAPGQEPETRGHSLRARLSEPEPVIETAPRGLGGLIKRMFKRFSAD